jgi:hypothetical protein
MPEYDSNSSYEGHWAANPKPSEVAAAAECRVREHYEYSEETGQLQLCHSSHSAFYGMGEFGHETSQIFEFGEDGEKLGLRANRLRALVKYVLLTVTADRPTVKPRATKMSAQALAQVPVARKLLDYLRRAKRMDRVFTSAVLRALLYGKSYVWQSWDPTLGPSWSPPPGDDGQPVEDKPEGDMLCEALGPMDVATDPERKPYDHDWFIVRVTRNRHDLVATFAPQAEEPEETYEDEQNDQGLVEDDAEGPAELRQRIMGAPSDILNEHQSMAIGFARRVKEKSRDLVFQYHLMHKRTPAVPDGRYMIFLAGGVVLYDGPLPYEDLPINEMVPEEFLEMGDMGYSSAWDLLALQEAYDAILSTCLTNMDAFGHNDIVIPNGVELGYEEIQSGLNVIRYPAGESNKPYILEKVAIQDSVFKLRDWLKEEMQSPLGVNSVALGDPQKSLESGSALALVQAQAVHFQNGVMSAYTHLVEDVSTNQIRICKRYMKAPRIAAISGPEDSDGIMAFSGQDIGDIDSVECEQVNPLFSTIAGRQNAADKLLERELIKDASQYIHMLETGRLELVTDDARHEDLYLRSLREALAKGPQVTPGQPDPMTGQPRMVIEGIAVTIADNPERCLKAARDVMYSIEHRKDVAVVTACTTYIQNLLHAWRSAPPDMLALLGYPLPPVMPGGPPAAPGAKEPMPGAESNKQAPAPGGPNDREAPPEGGGMPSMPKPAEPPPAQPPPPAPQ